MMGISLHDLERKYAAVDAASTPTDPRSRARHLVKTKESIESQLDAYLDLLARNGTDLTSPLVDASGFPRDDVADLATVRTARARIHELRNDLRRTMDELAVAMQDVFSPDPSVSHPQTTAVSMEERGGADKSDASSSTTTMRPFAKVNSVATNSPASKAGLLPSDRILRFADVAPSSSPSDDARLLGMVGEATRRNEGSEVTVVVMRGEEERQRMVVLTLRPTADWGGRGLLGCHILPL